MPPIQNVRDLKPPPRLWLRVGLSVLAFIVCFVPCYWLPPPQYLNHGLLVLEEICGLLSPTPGAAMGSPVSGWRQFPMPPMWLMSVNNALCMLALMLPPFWIALLAYHVTTFRGLPPDRLTRCGHCGQVLKNLVRPECPACARPL